MKIDEEIWTDRDALGKKVEGEREGELEHREGKRGIMRGRAETMRAVSVGRLTDDIDVAVFCAACRHPGE